MADRGARFAAAGAMQTAKLFKNGPSQAVRLPKDFRFEGEEVYVRREGEAVVLTPKRGRAGNPWQDLFDALDQYDPRYPIVREQPAVQQRRFLDEVAAPRSRRGKRQA